MVIHNCTVVPKRLRVPRTTHTEAPATCWHTLCRASAILSDAEAELSTRLHVKMPIRRSGTHSQAAPRNTVIQFSPASGNRKVKGLGRDPCVQRSSSFAVGCFVTIVEKDVSFSHSSTSY